MRLTGSLKAKTNTRFKETITSCLFQLFMEVRLLGHDQAPRHEVARDSAQGLQLIANCSLYALFTWNSNKKLWGLPSKLMSDYTRNPWQPDF